MRWLTLYALLPAVALVSCGGDSEPANPHVETIAQGLESPWEIAFLPDGRALVTERPGRVRLLDRDLTLREEPLAEMEGVDERGEAGLLGAAVDPRFASNGFVYFYIGALMGEQIRRLRINSRNHVVLDEALFEGEFGRIRTVVEGPDGAIYALTSNPTRGALREGDDRIVRIVPPADDS